MIYNYISSKTVIARLTRYFNDLSWTDTAILELSDIIQEVGFASRRKDTLESCPLTVANHKAEIPCNLVYLERIEINGCKVHLQNFSRSRRVKVFQETEQTADDTNLLLAGHEKVQVSQVNDLRNYYYYIDSPFIKTSFESGKVDIYYRAYDCDDEGYIMIPDIAEYKNALMWGVFNSLILQGFKPKSKDISIGFTENKYMNYKSMARSRVKSMSRDERIQFSRMWNSLNVQYSHSVNINGGRW